MQETAEVEKLLRSQFRKPYAGCCSRHIPLPTHNRYNELQCLAEVEKRLGGSVPRMGPDLSLPVEVSARIGSGGSGEVYGQVRGGGATKEVSEHMEAIRGTVESLAALEWQAQTSFNTLLRWVDFGGHSTDARDVECH